MTQDEYLSILFGDLGFSGQQKREYLRSRYKVVFTDSLTTDQKTKLIAYLKVQKENRKCLTTRGGGGDEVV